MNKLDKLKRGTAYHTGQTVEKNQNPQIRIDKLEDKIKETKSITLDEVKKQLDALWLEISRTKVDALKASTELDEKGFKITAENKITPNIDLSTYYTKEQMNKILLEHQEIIEEIHEIKDVNIISKMDKDLDKYYYTVQGNAHVGVTGDSISGAFNFLNTSNVGWSGWESTGIGLWSAGNNKDFGRITLGKGNGYIYMLHGIANLPASGTAIINKYANTQPYKKWLNYLESQTIKNTFSSKNDFIEYSDFVDNIMKDNTL